MLDDAPQALVDDADNAGGGHDRHLATSIMATCSTRSAKRLPSTCSLDIWALLDQELEPTAVPLGSSLGTVASFNGSV
jgi:hypothetical protein